jgi:hypothetical protein
MWCVALLLLVLLAMMITTVGIFAEWTAEAADCLMNWLGDHCSPRLHEFFESLLYEDPARHEHRQT